MTDKKTPWSHRQPFKAIHLMIFALSLPVIRIPLWALQFFLVPSSRPHPSWYFRTYVLVRIMGYITTFWSTIGLNNKRDLGVEVSNDDSVLKKEGARFAWVNGLDWQGEFGDVRGTLREAAESAGVRPLERLPAYWTANSKQGVSIQGAEKRKADKDEKVILHVHGGAFFVGTAHPTDPTSALPRILLYRSHTVSRSLSIDYRISAPFQPDNAFPAALLDALSAYKYLVTEMGFQASNITLVGDSAGGNLVIGLVRYLVECLNDESKAEPLEWVKLPRSIILVSPWSDLGMSHSEALGDQASAIRNRTKDIFKLKKGEIVGAYGVRSYLGWCGPQDEERVWKTARENSWVSPGSRFIRSEDRRESLDEKTELTSSLSLFKSFPRTYILVGSVEAIYDDSTIIYDRMHADGVDVTLDVEEGAIHEFLCFPWWGEADRARVAGRIGRWIDEDRSD